MLFIHLEATTTDQAVQEHQGSQHHQRGGMNLMRVTLSGILRILLVLCCAPALCRAQFFFCFCVRWTRRAGTDINAVRRSIRCQARHTFDQRCLQRPHVCLCILARQGAHMCTV